MVLELFLLVIVLGLIVFYAFEGLFSALIMALCSVLSLLLAVQFSEPLASRLVGASPRFADAFAWAIVFVLSLGLLRFAADKLLGGMVHFPRWVDLVGGAAGGVVTGLTVAGVLSIILRLMPFGPQTMGFQTLKDGTALTTWTAPESFVLGLIETVSAGSMRSDGLTFKQRHPDYLLEIAGPSHWPTGCKTPFSTRALVNDHPPAMWVTPDALPTDDRAAAFGAAQSPNPPRLLRVTLQPVQLEGDDGYLLAPTQAMLMARQVKDGKPVEDGKTALLMPRWITHLVEVKPGQPWRPQVERFPLNKAWQFKPTNEKPPELSLTYEVPEGIEPWFLMVKRYTRVELALPAPPPTPEP